MNEESPERPEDKILREARLKMVYEKGLTLEEIQRISDMMKRARENEMKAKKELEKELAQEYKLGHAMRDMALGFIGVLVLVGGLWLWVLWK